MSMDILKKVFIFVGGKLTHEADRKPCLYDCAHVLQTAECSALY